MRLARTLRRVRRGIRDLIAGNRTTLFSLPQALEGYSREHLRGDLTSGLNVALMAFPQGMAYAAVAGLPVSYGLYGSAVAAVLGSLFGGSRFLVLGPTNATSALLFAAFLPLGVAQAEKEAMLPLLLLLIGLFLMIGTLLRVANLIQYISRSVVTGYLTAAAIFIILNQARGALGINFDIPAGATFFDVVALTIRNLPDLQPGALILSLVTALVYWVVSSAWPGGPGIALILFLMAIVSAAYAGLVGAVPPLGEWLGGSVRTLEPTSGLTWPIGLPEFHDDWVGLLAPIALIIAFLSILEATSIGKSLAARAGERLDSNQTMWGLGMANFGSAFLGGMPASGSLTRSQLGYTSGARTPLSGVFSGLFCVVGIFVIGPFLDAIAWPVLAVLIIAIGIALINARAIRVVTKATASDRTVLFVTFIAALVVRLDFAIILGTATSILLFLRKASVPELVEYSFTGEGTLTQLEQTEGRPDPEVSIVHVEGDLFFGAADLFRDQMRRIFQDPDLRVVVLKMRNAHHLDATSVMALMELTTYMREQGRSLLVSEARKEAIRIFKNSGALEIIGRKNIFPDHRQNPTLSTARALRRAKEILGGAEARVSIYAQEQARAREEARKRQAGSSAE